jgi:hypothetical protein
MLIEKEAFSSFYIRLDTNAKMTLDSLTSSAIFVILYKFSIRPYTFQKLMNS